MKKVVLILTVILLACLVACKKKEEAPVQEKVAPKEITAKQFVVKCAQKADSIGLKGSVYMNTGKEYLVNGKSKRAFVELVDSVYTYDGFKPIIRDIPVNAKIWGSGPGLLIENYEDFLGYKGRVDSVRFLAPRPKYLITMDSITYYVKTDYGFWRKRKQE